MKRILIIDGHPNHLSLISAICDEYAKAASASGFETKRINIRELRFDPNLKFGYNKIQELEPDLLESQRLIKWCEHLVFAYPMWWGHMPAMTKGYLDRCWLPGFAFKFHEKGPFWDRLLEGRSARLIVTSDAPTLFNIFAYFNSPYTSVKKMIFQFCGFKPVRITSVGGVKGMTKSSIDSLILKISELGASGK